jgi:hypothetical protein
MRRNGVLRRVERLQGASLLGTWRIFIGSFGGAAP